MTPIRVTTLHCGTIHIKQGEAYLKGSPLFQQRIVLPNNAYLIQHPVHGNILVDTGWSYDCRSILPRHLLDFYDPQISSGQSAKDQLKAMGIHPEDLDLVLLTHLDVDHTCALKDFAGKAKRIACAETEYFFSCRTVYKRREVWDTWMPFIDQIERIYYRGSVLGPVGRGFDLFGDDSFLCIYCPGHTDGIFASIVSQGPSNRFHTSGDGIYGGPFVVLASDVAFSQKNLDDQVIPGYGFDRKQQMNGIQFLRKLQQDPNCKAILFSHSPDSSRDVIEY